MKPFTVKRPWGSFRRFDPGEIVTVKILRIKPKQELSLQYHKKRVDFWHIISGRPRITIGKRKLTAKPGDEFRIGRGVQHRIAAGVKEVVFFEIWFGTPDEQDIIRLKDRYGRA